MAYSMRASAFVNQAQEHVGVLKQCLDEVGDQLHEHKKNQRTIAVSRAHVLDDLVNTYLPALSPDVIDTVPRLTGYGQFQQSNPIGTLEASRRQLQSRLTEIESDSRYVDRERLLDSVAGDLILKRQQPQQEFELLQESLQRFEKEPNFLDLYGRKYGTSDYKERWWRCLWSWKYFRDWKAADIIVERFSASSTRPVNIPAPGQWQTGEMKQEAPDAPDTFRTICSDYERVRAAHQAVGETLQQVDGEIGSVKSLIDEHNNIVAKLNGGLEDSMLDQCRLQLRDHLEYMDRQELVKRAEGNDTIIGALKRLEGIEKKSEYLDALAQNTLIPERDGLTRSIGKLNQKIVKYQRPKYINSTIPISDTNSWLADPRPRLEKRRIYYTKVYTNVYSFDSYDLYDFGRDMLWWHLMAGPRYQASFIPEVADWDATHPAAYRAYEGDADAAGAALASAAVEDSFSPGSNNLAEAS